MPIKDALLWYGITIFGTGLFFIVGPKTKKFQFGLFWY
jgi:hypothetical protein